MTQTTLPPLGITVDFAHYAGDGTGPLWVEKKTLRQARLAAGGEVMQSGETAKAGDVMVYGPGNARGAPIYCVDRDQFLASSQPWSTANCELSAGKASLWFVEANPRRVVLVPESHGPFHLDAPAAWGEGKSAEQRHPGWDVTHVSELTGKDGVARRGFMLIESPVGPIHDKVATEAGYYRACARQPNAP